MNKLSCVTKKITGFRDNVRQIIEDNPCAISLCVFSAALATFIAMLTPGSPPNYLTILEAYGYKGVITMSGFGNVS